jgi:hypothetical protein
MKAPGAKIPVSHDRAALYVKSNASGFLQHVAPVAGGYDFIDARLEAPLYSHWYLGEPQIGGWIDVQIAACPKFRSISRDCAGETSYETLVKHGRLLRLGRELSERAPISAWDFDLFFVEIKPRGESIGQTLRQMQFYQHLWAQECNSYATDAAGEQRSQSRPHRYDGVHWILAMVNAPQPHEVLECQRIGVVVAQLNEQRVEMMAALEAIR